MHLTKRERAMIGLRMTNTQKVSVKRIRGLTPKYVGTFGLRDPADNIDQTGKGKFHDKCNRRACDERGEDIRWWNRAMRAFYCTHCMRLITRSDDWQGTENAIFDPVPHETSQ